MPIPAMKHFSASISVDKAKNVHTPRLEPRFSLKRLQDLQSLAALLRMSLIHTDLTNLKAAIVKLLLRIT
jgi:hypothetical protein